MRSFQTIFAILMAAMVNMALAAAAIHAIAMLLATTLIDTVMCSRFPHSIVAAPGNVKARQLFPHRKSLADGGCFTNFTFPDIGSANSTWVPWTALANEKDPDSELAVFYTFTTICKEISATILTRDIPVSCPCLAPLELQKVFFR